MIANRGNYDDFTLSYPNPGSWICKRQPNFLSCYFTDPCFCGPVDYRTRTRTRCFLLAGCSRLSSSRAAFDGRPTEPPLVLGGVRRQGSLGSGDEGESLSFHLFSFFLSFKSLRFLDKLLYPFFSLFSDGR